MDAAQLQARIALLERVHRVELELTRVEHAHAAAAFVRGRSHELGNQVQIAHLASLEIERRATPDQAELIRDLVTAAEAAKIVLAELVNVAHPLERTQAGDPLAAVLRAALDEARPAARGSIDVRLDLRADTRTRATASELEAIVFAIVLAAPGALRFAARERQIQGKPWVELLAVDDRRIDPPDHAFDAGGPLHVVELAAEAAGGSATLSAGREGLELAVELPVAQSSSSS